ncbi:MAG: tripartite tricarboxylate transporter permease [Lachnospiraceae bacterium]|nr:tripartite tricarboxylate transporter permease [Lachnospiraceae bacterium]
MATYLSSLMIVLQPVNLIALYLCSIIGCILGAIPGLAGGLGITLILPLTFAMSTDLSFAMLLGMYVGGVSGSFISSVLIGIPGSASSIATCFDGYPMTKRGKAAKALSIGITASFMGTALSVLIATFASKALANIALALGPWEYFSLCFMAVSMVIGMSNGSVFKGLIGAFLGVFLATIGTDSVSNQMRFTFGNYNLFAGVNVVCLLMGTFALQLVATSYAKGEQEMPEVEAGSLGGFGLTVMDFVKNGKTIVTSFLIGLGIGFLPGMGGGVASMISYGQAKKSSSHPETFGTGDEEGVWASEASNNASIGGALLPMISLGIPGDGTTVMLLSAMTIHGLQAGPMFITQHADLAYMIFAAVLVAAILVFITEIFTKRWFPLLLKAPYHYLYSAILMLCFLGAFASTTSMFSVGMVIFFGLFGVLMDYFEIPMNCLMLSYILGTNLETYFRRGMSYAMGDATSFFKRPVSCILLLIGIYSLLAPAVKFMIKKMRASKAA